MAITIRFKFKGKCPRHPHYNPAVDGFGGIKGACHDCQQLHRVWAFAIHAESAAEYFGVKGSIAQKTRACIRRELHI